MQNKVKLDSLDTTEELTLMDDFLSKQDLCSSYFHVLLNDEMHDNFGVHFVIAVQQDHLLEMESALSG